MLPSDTVPDRLFIDAVSPAPAAPTRMSRQGRQYHTTGTERWRDAYAPRVRDQSGRASSAQPRAGNRPPEWSTGPGPVGSVDFTWKMAGLTDCHLAFVSLASLAR